jgi:hypothetical protein
MTIYTNWQSFRAAFTQRHQAAAINVGQPLDIIAGPPAQFVRPLGASFAVDGWTDGMEMVYLTQPPGGTNEGQFLIDTVAGNVATLSTIEGPLVGQVAITVGSMEAFDVDPGGAESWPTELVRAAGFDGGIDGIPSPYTGAGAFTMTANALAADAVFGVDDFDWYFSQRTDNSSLQYFTPTAIPLAGVQSFSGSLRLFTNPANILQGIGWDSSPSTLTPSIIVKLFKYLDVYVRRRSDGAIQWSNFLREMQAAA